MLSPIGQTYICSRWYIIWATKTIYSTKVLENAGNRYIYTVTSLSTNAAMADAIFTFDKKKYPGVEEVDLR